MNPTELALLAAQILKTVEECQPDFNSTNVDDLMDILDVPEDCRNDFACSAIVTQAFAYIDFIGL